MLPEYIIEPNANESRNKEESRKKEKQPTLEVHTAKASTPVRSNDEKKAPSQRLPTCKRRRLKASRNIAQENLLGSYLLIKRQTRISQKPVQEKLLKGVERTMYSRPSKKMLT
ncbi:hypothetical protein OSTOST_18266 [Ostertagia ostertagi]